MVDTISFQIYYFFFWPRINWPKIWRPPSLFLYKARGKGSFLSSVLSRNQRHKIHSIPFHNFSRDHLWSTSGITCGRGSCAVHFWDHLQSRDNLGLGIICTEYGTVQPGQVPSDWGTATSTVAPVFKKGICEEPSNYRLMTVRSVLHRCWLLLVVARWNPSEGGDRGGLETRVASAIFGSWDKMAHLAINFRGRTCNFQQDLRIKNFERQRKCYWNYFKLFCSLNVRRIKN